MKAYTEYRWLVLAFGLLGAGFLFLYWPHLAPLEGRWAMEDNSYCYLVPLVFVYLVWEIRSRIVSIHCGSRMAGYFVMLLAGAVYLVGLLGSLETLVYGSMWLTISGGMLLVFGSRSLRALAFPLVVLAFAIPLPPFVIRLLTFRLKLLSSELAVRVLEMLSIPAYGEGNIIDMGVTKLQIVDACSGLRYLLPSILLALLIGYFSHSTWWKRLVLLLVSGPVTLVSNAFRIAMTGVLVTYVSPEFGEGFLHDFSGWVVYMLSIILLVGVSVLLKYVLPRKSPTGGGNVPQSESCPAAAGMARLWPHALACSLLLVSFSVLGSQLISRQVIPERASFEHFSVQMEDWRGKRLYLSKEVLDQLWADDYVTGSLRNMKTGNALHLLVSYYKRQTTVHTAHAPTSCLVGSGWTLEEKGVLPPHPEAGRDFPVTRMVLRQGKTTVISNFWFQQRGRHIVDEYKNKLWLVWDSFTRGRSDGALVRLELFLKKGQSLEEGQRMLDHVAGELKQRLMPYVPGAQE